jgi:hypothetical protein
MPFCSTTDSTDALLFNHGFDGCPSVQPRIRRIPFCSTTDSTDALLFNHGFDGYPSVQPRIPRMLPVQRRIQRMPIRATTDSTAASGSETDSTDRIGLTTNSADVSCDWSGFWSIDDVNGGSFFSVGSVWPSAMCRPDHGDQRHPLRRESEPAHAARPCQEWTSSGGSRRALRSLS